MPAPTTNEESKPVDPQEKAKIRRAQVRKAQIQHRQRKAEYVKQLEDDLAELREKIAQTQRESHAIVQENEAMKAALSAASMTSAGLNPLFSAHSDSSFAQSRSSNSPYYNSEPDTAFQNTTQTSSPILPLLDQIDTVDLFKDIEIDDMTISLAVDEMLGKPCFNLSSITSNEVMLPNPNTGFMSEASWNQLTPAQEQTAINFILALEHVCWDHYLLEHVEEVYPYLEGAGGHSLMASAYCIASAPMDAYSDAQELSRVQNQPPNMQWQSPGLTLQSLRGLSLSLGISGDIELTPVQAWFEMAERYPSSFLLQPHVLETLKRAFNGKVRCVYYGAVISREDFEGVVATVLGSPAALLKGEVGDLPQGQGLNLLEM
jgi:hypothetical protein